MALAYFVTGFAFFPLQRTNSKSASFLLRHWIAQALKPAFLFLIDFASCRPQATWPCARGLANGHVIRLSFWCTSCKIRSRLLVVACLFLILFCAIQADLACSLSHFLQLASLIAHCCLVALTLAFRKSSSLACVLPRSCFLEYSLFGLLPLSSLAASNPTWSLLPWYSALSVGIVVPLHLLCNFRANSPAAALLSRFFSTYHPNLSARYNISSVAAYWVPGHLPFCLLAYFFFGLLGPAPSSFCERFLVFVYSVIRFLPCLLPHVSAFSEQIHLFPAWALWTTSIMTHTRLPLPF